MSAFAVIIALLLVVVVLTLWSLLRILIWAAHADDPDGEEDQP